MTTKLVPDLTIIEAGVGPAIDVWPPSPGGGAAFPPPGDVPAFITTPAQQQATWFVDPANSTGVASDSNTGIDAAHPVLTYNGGIVPKWGTAAPTMTNIDVVLTWLSSQPVSPAPQDPVVLNPILENSTVVIQGVLGAAQQLHTGTIPGGGFVAKNRATQTLTGVDLGFAAPLGSLVQNTTVGKESFAWVYTPIVGTRFNLSQPLSPVALPIPNAFTATHEVNTWAVGDTFVVWAPVAVNLLEVGPLVAQFDAAINAPLVVQHVRGSQETPGFGVEGVFLRADVTVVESSFDSIVTKSSVNGSDQEDAYINTFLSAGLFSESLSSTWGFFGGALLVFCFADDVNLDLDAIVDVTVSGGGTLRASRSFPGAGPEFGSVYLAGTLSILGAYGFVVGQVTGLPTVLWGPGTLNVQATGRAYYGGGAGAAVATFTNVGGLELNGQTLANPFSPATGVWEPRIALTSAALDAAFGPAGFGGLAMNLGGGSFTNQATP